MKKLTPLIAKEIAEKYFLQKGDKAEQDFSRTHTEAVVEVALILAKKFHLDESLIERTAWVHDIGKVINMADHEAHAISLLEKEGIEVIEIERDCILNHGVKSSPKSEEAKVIQMSDKLSILSIPMLTLLFEQESVLPSDVEFYKKMTEGSLNFLRLMVKQ